MIKPSDVIKATGSDPAKPYDSKTNPLGLGHGLYAPDQSVDRIGMTFRCAGLPGPDDILVQHTIMTLVQVPTDCEKSGMVPSERADEAKWELDEAQTAIDPANPVCQVCGQPIIG